MAKIEWTDRSDWNPVRGCTRVSPGCGGPGDHGGCYAEAMAARFSLSAAELEAKWRADPNNAGKDIPIFKDQWGHGFAEMKDGKPRWTGKVALQEDRLTIPLSWRQPARVFPNSTSDFFHDALPDEAIDKIFAVMALCPHLTFQVLTKRAERMRDYFDIGDSPHGTSRRLMKIEDAMSPLEAGKTGPQIAVKGWPLPNIWLGVSCERQQEADERRDYLGALARQGWLTFVSYEPALGPVDWSGWEFLKCLISGGESGPRARLSHPDWHRSARDWCGRSDIAYFFKQWGAWGPVEVEHDGSYEYSGEVRLVAPSGQSVAREDIEQSDLPNASHLMERVGKQRAGRLLDGREHNEFPYAARSAGTLTEQVGPTSNPLS